MSGIRSFSAYQKKILAALFAIYFCTYIGRLNMSATLDHIIEAFSISASSGGLLQTLWAVFYAAGQLVFGTLSDRFVPKRLISVGLIGSAACNALFSFSGTFASALAIWTLNGVFQSMIWTPVVICMAATFEDSQRKSASLVMSFTLAAGHLAAWAIAMRMAEILSWRWSYRIPALVLCAAAVIAMTVIPRGIRKLADTNKSGKSAERAPVRELYGTGLFLLLLCCVTNGFIRDGVITWGPTILGANKGTKLFSLIIPCINMLGILLGAYLVRRVKTNIRALVGLMLAGTALPGLALFAGGALPVYLTALLLGVMSALLYGTNPLLTTLVPMQYDEYGRVGLAAGLTDCFIYLGSSLSGYVTGRVHDISGGWTVIYLTWAAAAIVGCVLAIMSSRRRVHRL
ncbi:MAG: MFS transporter [Clostridia bacterium]|nr:MFS transporter [Clostridia bacterium]